MNDITLCDKELNNVMDVEGITLNSTHGSMGSWDRPERFIPNAPAFIEGDERNQLLRECTARHNAAYEEIVLQEFPEESNMEHNDGLTHYIAIDDLPEIGDAETVYKVDSTGDLFVFRNNQYCEYNPYALPSGQVTAPRVMIEDDSAFMPHGGMGPLAVIYNIHALRRDLVLKQIMGWTWDDMIPEVILKGISKNHPKREELLRLMYFKHSHKALMEQLRTHLRYRGEFNKEYVDALTRVGTDIWYTDNQYGFKDGDFVVQFA